MTFAIIHFSKIAFVIKNCKPKDYWKNENLSPDLCDLIIIDRLMFVFQNFFKFECVINIFLT